MPRGRRMPKRSSSASNLARSSATSMLSALVPRMRTPWLSRYCVSLIAVCPPKATTTPTGRSAAITFITSSGVRGSK